MKNKYLNQVFAQLRQTSEKVAQDFGDLSTEQLNWKPNPNSWSIAQCLEHLNNTARLYYSKMDAMGQGNFQPNFFERIHLFSGFFGKLLLGLTSPEIKKKTKTLPAFEPSKSEIPKSIIQDHLQENEIIIRKMKALDTLDHHKTYLSSLAGNAITYSLFTLCTLLGNHAQRHYHQALNIKKEHGFPDE